MPLQRQHILLSYFKTLSVGPVWGLNPRPPARQSGALPTEPTRRLFTFATMYTPVDFGTVQMMNFQNWKEKFFMIESEAILTYQGRSQDFSKGGGGGGVTLGQTVSSWRFRHGIL